MSALPQTAREGLMRAWLDILRERHPEVTWIPAETIESNYERERTSAAPKELALTK